MEFILASNDNSLNDHYFIRKKVFVEGQNIPLNIEIDELEDTTDKFVLYDDEKKPIGAIRGLTKDSYVKVQRVCILPKKQNLGYGKILMNSFESFYKNKGIKTFKLGSQISAMQFYKKLGYIEYGDIFLDAGIEHVMMKKTI